MKCTNSFLREEKLAEQVQEYCQKVSIPDEWRDKYLAKVKEWEKEQTNSSGIFVQKLNEKLKEIAVKIDRLSNGYLEGAFELNEYHQKKNELVELRKSIEEKLSDFERKGNYWLELLKSWILEANQSGNLANTKNFFGMKNFLKTVGSNRIIQDEKLSINFPKQYNLLLNLPAEARAFSPREAASEQLNSLWWTRQDLNLRPSACHADALPLSYEPPHLQIFIRRQAVNYSALELDVGI